MLLCFSVRSVGHRNCRFSFVHDRPFGKSASITLFLFPETIFHLSSVSLERYQTWKNTKRIPGGPMKTHKMKPNLQLITNVAPKARDRKCSRRLSRNTADTTFPSVHIREQHNHQTKIEPKSKYNVFRCYNLYRSPNHRNQHEPCCVSTSVITSLSPIQSTSYEDAKSICLANFPAWVSK